MPNGQLEKMKIYAYNNPELSTQHQVGEPFTAMMEFAVTLGSIGSSDSVFTKGFPGVMLSTLVGARRR